MIRYLRFSEQCRDSTSVRLSLPCGALLLGLCLFAAIACKGHARTSDPKLKKIEEMLDGQLPPGTTLSRVTFFLNSRGYEYRIDGQQKKVIARIQKVDEETLTRVAARVEFEFDQNDKLVDYELRSDPVGP